MKAFGACFPVALAHELYASANLRLNWSYSVSSETCGENRTRRGEAFFLDEGDFLGEDDFLLLGERAILGGL